MRLKRMCETKPSGKTMVPAEVQRQFQAGNRDELTLALTLALKKHGVENSKKHRDMVRSEFLSQVERLHEKARKREEEIEGGWYTEERMLEDLKDSQLLG